MDPLTSASLELLKYVEGKNVPLTLNHPQQKGVVFVYSGEDWELFSHAIRQAVDQLKESLLERERGP
jgi:hypothetical protein